MDKFLEVLNSQATVSVVEGVKTAISKLGDGALYVGQIFVKQQAVVGFQGIIWVVMALIIIFYMWKAFKWACKKSDEDSYDFMPQLVLVFSALVGMSVALSIPFVAIDSAGRLMNPEYYAIQDAVKLIQDKTNEE